jgi:hypothetical protein
MGIVFAEIISRFMYQQGIQKVLREHGLNFNDFWSLEHMQQLMSDVFKAKHYELKFKPTLFNVEQSTQEIIFKSLIFPVLQDLVISMTHLEPALRLKNSSLEQEIARLKAIEKIGLRLAKNLQDRVQNALEFWELGQELSKDLSEYKPLDPSTAITPQKQMEYMESDMKELIKMLVGNHEGTNELKSSTMSSSL